MSPRPKHPFGFEDSVLGILAYEFPFTDKLESERKIKQKLRRRRLGPLEQERIEVLRQFKNAIQEEVRRSEKSDYYTSPHGKRASNGQHYAHIDDFDRDRMTQDYSDAFPKIPQAVIRRFVDMAVFTYYLR